MIHFHFNEFIKDDWKRIPDFPMVMTNIMKLGYFLERVRLHIGDLPIYVNSCYRTPLHNKAVGGVPNSQHLTGAAVDITTRSEEGNEKLLEALETYAKHRDLFPFIELGQIIVYTNYRGRKHINFIHIGLPTATHKFEFIWK